MHFRNLLNFRFIKAQYDVLSPKRLDRPNPFSLNWFGIVTTVGLDSSRCYWCLQLCTVMAGQAVMRKLDETQTANMVKAAARPPDERKRRIMDAVRRMEWLI